MSKFKNAAAMPAQVVVAEQAEKQALDDLLAARARVKQLEAELAAARDACHSARLAADDLLPQCDMVSICWRSGKVNARDRAVIVRQTAAGSLVIRRVGYPPGPGSEERYKWADGRYISTKKRALWLADARELRNVPPEFKAGASQPTR